MKRGRSERDIGHDKLRCSLAPRFGGRIGRPHGVLSIPPPLPWARGLGGGRRALFALFLLLVVVVPLGLSAAFFPFSSQTCFSPSPVPESRAVLVTVLSSESSHCRMLLHQKTLWSVPLSADSFSFCVADVSALQRPRRQHPTGLARRRFRFP